MTKIKKDVFFDAVENFIIDQGELPPEEHILCDTYGLDLESFYGHFQSMDDVYSKAWLYIIESTLQVLSKDKQYPEFSIREKLLAFYFTQEEYLNRYKSFVRITLQSNRIKVLPKFLKAYKTRFDTYITSLVDEGFASGEVAKRLLPSKHYVHGFWVQLLFILRFYANDESQDKEKTDAAIEKAVNLSLDLIAPGPLESIFDLGKFIVQNRK